VVYSSGKGHGTMHEFKIGQYVYYVPRNRFKKEGRYVVMRLLPHGTKGGPHYIIRSQDEESEYTAEASELRKAPGARSVLGAGARFSRLSWQVVANREWRVPGGLASAAIQQRRRYAFRCS
jgi:hypothetical protein